MTERAVPYLCPFCGEEDLRPVPDGGWNCRGCLRVFSLTFHGTWAGQDR
jgi:ribosomal protein L37AE/L43A